MPTLAPYHQYLRNDIPAEYHPLHDYDTNGRRVEPGEYDDGLRDLSHESRDVPHVRTPPAPARIDKVRAAIVVPDGTYTIVMGDERRTLRVVTQADDDKFAPGDQVVSYLSGPDNDNDYTGFAFIRKGNNVVNIWKKMRDKTVLIEALRVLVADPKAAAQAYGLESGECALCHRTLTTPASIALGIGPVCAQKAGW